MLLTSEVCSASAVHLSCNNRVNTNLFLPYIYETPAAADGFSRAISTFSRGGGSSWAPRSRLVLVPGRATSGWRVRASTLRRSLRSSSAPSWPFRGWS